MNVMDQIGSIVEQTRLFVVQHAPSDVLREAVPAGIVFLIAGIGLSVLGAKLSRPGITLAWGIFGAFVGAYVARLSGFPTVVCAAVGALMVGLIGYQTFRLWIGVAAALVFSSATLGVFGYQKVIPHVGEFERAIVLPSATVGGEFVLPTAEQQQAYRDPSPREWFQQFWSYVTQQDATVSPNSRALGIAALITGLCVGILATRWALIVATSLVGTAMVATGAATLMSHISGGESIHALQKHPALMGVAVGGFLLTSIVLQAMLTRSGPKTEVKPA